jgi:SAM-dependent methyltransferase
MKLKDMLRVARSPKYLRDLAEFKRLASAQGLPLVLGRPRPILNDATAITGFDEHYVYHTGWAARILRDTRPVRHVDISSSLMFVSIASAIVPIDHYDYRPPDLKLDNVTAGAADLQALPFDDGSIPSLSCMHVVEHVGLGRYGDPIDPSGDSRAMAELSRVVAPGGQFLFVTPVGRPRVEFNAHRVYAFEDIRQQFSAFDLVEFALVPDSKTGTGTALIRNADSGLVAEQSYGCGCFYFLKRTS